MPSSGLTAKQAAFAAEYLKDLNKTQAAIRCGYAPKNAATHGVRLYRNVKVRAEIDAALKRRSERVEVKTDDVLRELIRIFSADISLAYDVNGKLRKLHEIPEDVRRAIIGIKSKELFEGYGEEREYIGDLVEVKFADKVRALELAMKHLGLLVDKVKVEVDDSFATLLKQARERAQRR